MVAEQEIQGGCAVGINPFPDLWDRVSNDSHPAAAGVVVEGPYRIRCLGGGGTCARVGDRGCICDRRGFGDRAGRGRCLRGRAGAAVVGAACAGQPGLVGGGQSQGIGGGCALGRPRCARACRGEGEVRGGLRCVASCRSKGKSVCSCKSSSRRWRSR